MQPAIEMYHVAGFIPEKISFKENPDVDSIWARMKQNFKEGNIMLALGCEKKRQEFQQLHGYSFAVLELKEVEKTKLLKCMNPSTKFHCTFASFTPDESTEKVGIGDLHSTPKLKTRRPQEDSTFWISWEAAVKHFSHLHIGWNPAIYPFKKAL